MYNEHRIGLMCVVGTTWLRYVDARLAMFVRGEPGLVMVHDVRFERILAERVPGIGVVCEEECSALLFGALEIALASDSN